ncbi:hypothetical protein FB388_3615 [Pseudonocardia cypriaca]|uniref:Uncharacterized protein n=2 Tax=Pseudonocardia cypriaca TaxID=882449 RepID=A0A543GJD4_9PSEU|nr:hypothetical protein FB388_3615 [Pseudonocardia cypriaca]
MSIYHKASAESVDSIFTDGLRCSRRGPGHDEPRVRRTNDVLDDLRPDHLRLQGLDRNACTYCYLVVDGLVFDVESGRLVPERDWLTRVGGASGAVALRLAVDPAVGYVSDLEVYDELAARIDDASDRTVHKLAQRYWERVVALPDLCRHYRRSHHALVRRAEAPAGLPSRLERVEVLLTADVPPDRIAPAS